MQHIPYRNTSLTKMLKSSLGGNTKTCIILCVSPSVTQFEQSLATFKFGIAAGKIENKAIVNVSKANSEETLKLLIGEYQNRLAYMDGREINFPSFGKAQNSKTSKQISELKSENEMLIQQLNSASPKGKILLQFSLSDKENVIFSNGDEKEINLDGGSIKSLIRKLVDCLKIKCKQAYLWEKTANQFKDHIQILEASLNNVLLILKLAKLTLK
jgi:hypothetical protein